MEQFDIEAYLDGTLDESSRAAFEAEMRRNPTFAKAVESQRRLAKDLQEQLLREQVASALSAGKGGSNGRWLAGLGLLAIAVLAAYFLWPADVPAPPQTPVRPSPDALETLPGGQQNQPAGNGETPAGNAPPPQQKEKKAPQKDRPIAGNKPLPGLLPPPHPSPNVRGENAVDAEKKALLDAVWYMDFPPKGTGFPGPLDAAFDLLKKREFTQAYPRLQLLERKMPDSDSLFFLKAYCLLEMGEGRESLTYFDKIKTAPPGWQGHVEWYRGLAHLLADDRATAAAIFQKIKGQPGHPFHQAGEKAWRLLE